MKGILIAATAAALLGSAPAHARWEGDDPAERLLLEMAERVDLVAEELDGLEDVVIGAYLEQLNQRLVVLDLMAHRLGEESPHFAVYCDCIETVQAAVRSYATVEDVGMYRDQIVGQLEEVVAALHEQADEVREEVDPTSWPMLLRLGDALQRMSEEL